MATKHLDARGKGEIDYDYKEDTLFFKIKDREYMNSLDFEGLVVDIDKEGFLTGIQIFDASQLFGIPKEALRNTKFMEFSAKAQEKEVILRFRFIAALRNKSFMQQGQDIIREATAPLASTEMMCTMKA